MEQRLNEINVRLAEIRSLIDEDGADFEALNTEADALIAERKAIQEKAEKRKKLLQSIVDGSEPLTRKQFFPDNDAHGPEKREYNAGSPEYRSAWLKKMATDNDGNMLLGDMNKEERAAFTFMTSNTGAVVPKEILNKIVELVESTSPLLDDATITGFAKGFGVPRHKAIVGGDATETAEGVENEDSNDDFDLLSLDGVEIKRHLVMTKKMEISSIEAFEAWLTKNLADRIRVAKEKVIYKRLGNETYGIAAENKIGGTLSDAEFRRIFSLIKGQGAKAVYANSTTIWSVIAGLTNEKGEKLFIPNSMSDPIVAGRIYGAAVKLDDNLTDNKVYVGISKAVLANNFSDFEIHSAVEPKTLNKIITGYSLFDAGLENPKSFVEYTHQGE